MKQLKLNRLAATFAVLISASTYAANIEQLNVNVTGSKGQYTSVTDAILVGDYNRYITRWRDIDHYADMGVPNIVESKDLGGGLSWVHMSVFLKKTMYYTQSRVQLGPQISTLHFSLVPKRGSYPEKHEYQTLTGDTTIKVISGSGENTKFSVHTVNHVVFKPGAFTLGAQSLIAKIARGSVKAFAK
jgi:hypothetical protein